MKKKIQDIAQIVLFSSLFSALLSLFPPITLEGAFIFMGCMLFIASGFAASSHKNPDRRIFKYIASGRNQKFFDERDPVRINRKTSEDAFTKIVISGVILFFLSYIAFYL
ncbi:hypothetical protein [Fusibacter sp. 3D3]|uniref:hypothetical protein n=1 Tax=Fusibacter sp. 3D3 TaxID=1048380 RepID=UPI000852E4E9|nr:hypothetical protein [Fusibacter sp. 3D3]